MKKVVVIILGILTFTNAVYSQLPGGKVSYIKVVNISAYQVDVSCERTENSIADTLCENVFCWGICYTPQVSVSTEIISIGAGATSNDFSGHYYLKGSTGTSVISYCFYISTDTLDSACVTIMYSPNSPDDSIYTTVNIGALVGIDGLARENEIIDIYPNPAITNATVEYSLARGSRSASIVVRNLLGAEIMDIQLKGSTGTAILPVHNMDNGVYFYSLVVDGQVRSAQKLVVKK